MIDYNKKYELDDGLVLRWATTADTEKVAEFNGRLHSESPDQTEQLKQWTRDLMSGNHPATKARDFLVVENEAGDIVSSTCHISQTWGYDGISFKVGRPELVATDEKYRRRGLVRKQFDLVHQLSKSRGELMQAITGIPWYYRQFGYEMGLDLGGGRRFTFIPKTEAKKEQEQDKKEGKEKEQKEPAFSWRKAAESDIEQFDLLYQNHCMASMIYTERDRDLVRFELFGHSEGSLFQKDWWLIENRAKEAVAYIKFAIWGNTIFVQELGCKSDQSLRAVGLYITEALQAFADEYAPTHGKPIIRIFFNFGVHHPLYDALDPELESVVKSYAWYIRIPDYAAFLNHIKPVLEDRLANSVMAGHTGKLRLTFYNSTLQLTFANGTLEEIAPYEMKFFADADASFPDLQFIQLLCGRRTIDELQHIHADCYARSNDAKVLLKILFPKRPSQPIGIS